jgi:hypothetical protein
MSVDSRNTPTSPSEALGVPGPQPELLSSLGQLARGLSALFWGLPIALVICVQSAKSDWLSEFPVFPAVIVTSLLYYGLALLGGFQPQERVWRAALDRVKIVALVNIGLSPFLYFWNRIPSNAYFNAIVHFNMVTGLIFLLLLNPMLLRLTAMLPDETLRLETRLFTTLNRYLLSVAVIVFSFYFITSEYFPIVLQRAFDLLFQLNPFPQRAGSIAILLDRGGVWITLVVLLLPVAMTMALIWKVKEVILSSVFGGNS